MISVTLPLKVTTPSNGTQGNSRIAAIIKSRSRKMQRGIAHLALKQPAAPARKWIAGGGAVEVKITRIAPRPLDSHDNARSAMKHVADGVTDALGLSNDRDPRLCFTYAQARAGVREYAVKVEITNLPQLRSAFE